jgi:signal transduction histidine kinase
MRELKEPGVAGLINNGREVIGLHAKGGLIPLFVTLGRMGNEEKFCAVLRDMTPWKKAEEELVSARRAAETASEQKSDFLARVSHEIRTPLNAIIGFSDVMIEERFGPIGNERYRGYLRDINRSGVHVLDLINDLLDISKIEAGKMELSYEAVDLNQLVAETVALLQPQANGERIIIRTSLSRAVPRVVADARSIRQIILNLVSNAIKFTPANGQVIISTVYEGNGEVVMRVRDTGRGMSDREIEQAMKPFHQINVMDEKRGQGTGLGLPLTKALVEANRAYFDLESTPGEGTIAHVHFPTQRVLAD